MRLKNADFVEIFQKHNDQTESKNVELCFKLLSSKNIIVKTENEIYITHLIQGLRKIFRRYWSENNRDKEKFVRKHKQWLTSDFGYEFKKKRHRRKSNIAHVGRPSVPFYSKSIRGKRQSISSISKKCNYDTDLLISATLHSGRRKGNMKLASAIKIFMKTYDSPPSRVQQKMSSDEGLALLLDTELSQKQYRLIKKRLKDLNCDVLPSYHEILKSKETCRPKNLSVSSTKASVPIGDLLDHTTRRIVTLCENELIRYMDCKNIDSLDVKMINKYGFDGSSGQSEYNQEIDSEKSDSNLFAVTLSPLVLNCEDQSFWQNSSPSSVRYCRPISLEFIKESKEHNISTKTTIETQINELENIVIILSNKKAVTVNQICVLTAIDGKVFSHITNTSSMQCCVCCKSPPSMMNNLLNDFTPDPTTLIYGISPLHSWIRFFEAVIHISYKLDLKKWRVSGEEDKANVKQRKMIIQRKFKERFHLNVDKPLSGGSGNSNTGNVARKAFSNPKLFAEITGIDEKLIERLRIILITISSNHFLDVNRFGTFCMDTAKLYVEKYNWYYMPASLHKVLIHGADIARNSILPLGMLSEEGAEARNKYYKRDRLMHSRKNSRLHTMHDLFCRQLDASDPVISEFGRENRLSNHAKYTLPAEVSQLLKKIDTETGSRNDFTMQVDREIDEIMSEDESSLNGTFNSVLDNIELIAEISIDE